VRNLKRRIAAEWEPAVGVIVAWPPSVPRSLVQELAKDTNVYMIVPDKEEHDLAVKTLTEWNVDLKKVEFIFAPQGEDYTWPRDWGPQPLFKEDGSYAVLGPRYVYSTPFCGPEADAPLMTPDGDELDINAFDGIENGTAQIIAQHFGYDYIDLPFAFTGGNVLTDGRNNILSTVVLLKECEFDGVGKEEYFKSVSEITGMTNYSVFSDYENFGLQHIDCFLKILDEERLLVTRPPADNEYFERYESIVNNELSKVLNCYGRPYEIIRLDTGVIYNGELAAYCNSLILNKTVYVPMYSIPQDKTALQQWAEAMPGYTIKGFEYLLSNEPETRNERGIYEYIGWGEGDVIHCRTRAVWDHQMLYISVRRVDSIVNEAEEYPVYINIIDYSRKGLIQESLKLYFRKKGMEKWNEIQLTESPAHEVYYAAIPGAKAGDVVEYYAAASDHSGRNETMPRTAPTGFYQFTVIE